VSLRRKLLTTFSGFALMALIIAGITLWATTQWQATEEQLQGHYGRSLQLQSIRATIFRAFKEVADAVSAGDQDARQEFEQILPNAEEDFREWSELIDTEEERQEVQQIRAAYDEIVEDADRVFDLMDAGRQQEAFALLEGDLEDNDFRAFEELSEQAVASDRERRLEIRAQTENARRTAQIVLTLVSFGTISLTLLLFAYLASDLFAPLREVAHALDDVARGNLERRIEQNRADELGTVAAAFNRMVEAIGRRGYAGAVVSNDSGTGDGASDGMIDGTWRTTPSRLTLHSLVAQLQARVKQHEQPNDHSEAHTALVDDINRLTQAIVQMTEFGFPLDLNMTRTDIRAMLYDLALRFHDEFIERTVSLELHVAPDVRDAMVDRLKLREALAELVKNALAALPPSGGSIGVRASLASEGKELVLEVADDGRGAEPVLINRSFSDAPHAGRKRGGGLDITRAIIEQHGGTMVINTQPNEGTHVEIRLPMRR
jgi:two-component system, OmpR family, sensor kinase